MTTRRIAVIGLGQRIAHVLAAMKEVGWDLAVDGYVDENPVGAPILDAAGILPGRPFATPEQLLAAGPYDLVMIGSPNHLHFEHLTAAFAAGFPIFAEKPIVRTEAESLQLARRLSGAPVPPLYIGLVMRARRDRCALAHQKSKSAPFGSLALSSCFSCFSWFQVFLTSP